MLESIKKISNPLTIIAVFAGLAEVSGTGVLPFLANDIQHIYVWFLMLFPTLLIILFFATLNWNYKVLYAPSDYKDEGNFIKLFGKPTLEEKISKLQNDLTPEDEDHLEAAQLLEQNVNQEPLVQETPDAQVDVPNIPNSKEANKPVIDVVRHGVSSEHIMPRFLLDNFLIQDYALTKISKEFSHFNKEASLRTSKNNYLFDAVGVKAGLTYAIEVHVLEDSESSLGKITNSVTEFTKVLQELFETNNSPIHVILVLITDLPSEKFNALTSLIWKQFDVLHTSIEIRKLEFSKLKKELKNELQNDLNKKYHKYGPRSEE